MDMVTEARELARAKLALELPQRWQHVEAAAAEAQRIAPAFGADATVLLTVVWLHDLGHAPELVQTGFHPLDAANYLQAEQWLPRLVDLVANQSAAAYEATIRGLRDEFAGFSDEASPTRDALWYCSLTAGSNGERTDVEGRMAEIAQCGSGGLATVLGEKARAELTAAVNRTRQRLKAARL